MKYEAVFLDWDGTLSNSRFWGQWAEHPGFADSYTGIQKHLFIEQPELVESWMRGSQTAETIVDNLSQRIAMGPSLLLDGLKKSCRDMQLVDEDILPVVKALRERGLKVIVATDNMDTFTRWTVPALGLMYHFDNILDSYGLQSLKCDALDNGQSAFFSKYFDDHAIDPTKAILIDNSIHSDVIEGFGLHYAQVTSSLSALAILKSL